MLEKIYLLTTNFNTCYWWWWWWRWRRRRRRWLFKPPSKGALRNGAVHLLVCLSVCSYVASATYINVVTLFTSSPALSVVFFVCFFVVVVCLVLLSLVAAAFLANKDVCVPKKHVTTFSMIS